MSHVLTRACAAVGVAFLALLAAPTAAGAATGVDVTFPVPQSEAVPGEFLPIEGAGCAPGASVTASANGHAMASTTADDHGLFSWAPRLPADVLGGATTDEPEAGEILVEVRCGGSTTTVVLVAAVHHGRSAAHTALLLVEGFAAPVITVVFIVRARRRSRAAREGRLS